MSCLTGCLNPLKSQLDLRAEDFVATRNSREALERILRFTGGPLRVSGGIVVERAKSCRGMIGQPLVTEDAPTRLPVSAATRSCTSPATTTRRRTRHQGW